MNSSKRQGKLTFNQTEILSNNSNTLKRVGLDKRALENWQLKVCSFQAQFFEENSDDFKQVSLFTNEDEISIDNFEPLKLTPLPLNFWRWPKSPHEGPAIYLVMDRPKIIKTPILLYVGETISAEKRWKGNHDCKNYLSAYSEALTIVKIETNLSIRFWNDVPRDTPSRRKIEQLLIQRWQPPFNKETRTRWATPFTADIF